MAQELDARTRIEIETLHDVLDEVDFYALLQLRKDADPAEVESAFAKESRHFHPDRFFGVRDPVFLRKLTAIYRKTSEAYSVLRNPELRQRYDRKLGHGAAPAAEGTTSLSSDGDPGAGRRTEVCKTQKGQRYYDLARTAQRKGDANSMAMNLHFALSFEPDNEMLKQMLQEAKQSVEEQKAKQAFKVRIR